MNPKHRRLVVLRILTLCSAAVLCVTGCTSSNRSDPSPQPTRTHTPVAAPEPVATSPAVDAGPVAHAAGTATTLASGRFDYTVVSDVTASGIAGRFRLCLVDLVQANTNDIVARELSVGQHLRIERESGPHHGAGECDLGYW